MYGDTAILDRHFGAMTRWMDFLERANPDYLRARELGNSYNDWLTPGDDDTPHELLATAYWAHDAALMAEIAGATGRPDDAAGYRALWSKIRSAFAEAFVAADGQVASGTQTAYVLSLHMNLVPDDLRAAAADRLVTAIRTAGWHLTTGFAGVGYLLPVLSSTGHTAVAYRLLEQASVPSWRYMVEAGATTIWERWDGWTSERGFQSPWMNSFNHYSLGSVGEWLYRFVLGIDQAPDTAGFGRLLIRPHPGGSLSWARGAYRSVRGPVRTGWQRDGGRLRFQVELPPNVTASVRIPSDDPGAVRDGAGNPPASLAGFPGARDAREAVFQIGSGAHEFSGPAMTDPGQDQPGARLRVRPDADPDRLRARRAAGAARISDLRGGAASRQPALGRGPDAVRADPRTVDQGRSRHLADGRGTGPDHGLHRVARRAPRHAGRRFARDRAHLRRLTLGPREIRRVRAGPPGLLLHIAERDSMDESVRDGRQGREDLLPKPACRRMPSQGRRRAPRAHRQPAAQPVRRPQLRAR
jgi:Bacterial alpha-L-rhamnosidase 6 hairpin glycosidase domain/Bacterial alpha-L-rhamnosidase C-terminal domain